MSGLYSSDNEALPPVPQGVDDAVGVPERNWYVAIVNNRSEILAVERLVHLGYEAYAATQKEMRVWRNGRKKIIDRVVITSLIFVRCTEIERKEIVALPFINRFMTDRATGSDGRRSSVAIVPDHQICMLRYMLGNSDTPVDFVSHDYRRGEPIKVVRGSLSGTEGEVIEIEDGKGELIVRLDILGCARCTIKLADVVPLKH